MKALYVHLAEGTDETSRREFGEVVERGLLMDATDEDPNGARSQIVGARRRVLSKRCGETAAPPVTDEASPVKGILPSRLQLQLALP